MRGGGGDERELALSVSGFFPSHIRIPRMDY